MAILPNYFTKFEMRHGRFVDENNPVTEQHIDPMCGTLKHGCYPFLVTDRAKLVDHTYGAAEAKNLLKWLMELQALRIGLLMQR